MTQKRAVLLSCSDHYGHRLFAAEEALRICGCETVYITSDFDHNTKQVYTCPVEGCVQLHAKPYRKNLSVARILSHRQFARDAFRYLERLPWEPDAVIAVVPPNFMAYYGAKYKKRHPNVRLVFDIFDLWPETFPSGKAKKLLAPAFALWAWVRDHHLGAADLVTTECEMFRQKLGLSEESAQTVYLCAEPVEQTQPVRLREDGLDLCYLGAINNVIGIPEICDLLGQLTREKQVTLHIIGKGERQQELIDGAKNAGAEVVFYGPVFDDEKKREILGKCHFGLNLMKSSVCIGLTMKSVEYFRYGLPIINSIPADTGAFVKQRRVGIQWGPDCARQVLACTNEECLKLRENVRELFDGEFAKEKVLGQYTELFRTRL